MFARPAWTQEASVTMQSLLCALISRAFGSVFLCVVFFSRCDVHHSVEGSSCTLIILFEFTSLARSHRARAHCQSTIWVVCIQQFFSYFYTLTLGSKELVFERHQCAKPSWRRKKQPNTHTKKRINSIFFSKSDSSTLYLLKILMRRAQ